VAKKIVRRWAIGSANQRRQPVMSKDSIDNARLARQVMRACTTAALASLDAGDGWPAVSLVLVGLSPQGQPVLLLSDLARHSANISHSDKVGLLFDGTVDHTERLTGPRVSLKGRLKQTQEPADRARYLARHQSAETYADFADFAFYRMTVLEAYLVAGFGRIVTIPADQLLADADAAARIAAFEPRMLAEYNDRHGAAIRQAVAASGGGPGPWRVIGADVDGADLAANGHFFRVSFETAVDNADAWCDAVTSGIINLST
jgi:hypothetical protein